MAHQQLLKAATASLGNKAEDQPLLHPVKGFARKLGVSVEWARDQYYAGKLKGHKLAGRLMIPHSELLRIVAESEKPYSPATSGIGTIAPALNRKRAAERRKQKAAKRKTRTKATASD